ncbi:hypothetical protein [Lentilactobacillus hilgardii]|uniref:hypothetical protein n=1 Tax=Lentilactobacillus hilgardii TaxID=1588 RepID=UPI003FA523F4
MKGSIMMTNTTDWKAALNSKEDFKNFITDYFAKHEELTGNYENTSYYEYYTVRLDSKDGLIITLTTGINTTGNLGVSPVPFKDVEKLSVEQFRQLILNKKFADMHTSLADVFKTVAGVPDAVKE